MKQFSIWLLSLILLTFSGCGGDSGGNNDNGGDTSSDTTAPYITNSGSTTSGVSVNGPVTIYFSESLSSSLNLGAINISPTASFNASLQSDRIVLEFTTPMEYDTTYTVTLPAVSDLAGNTLNGGSLTFSTESDPGTGSGSTVPEVTATSIENNATDVDPTAGIVFTFNTDLSESFSEVTVTSSTGNPYSGQIMYNYVTKTVTVNPGFNTQANQYEFDYGAAYTIVLTGITSQDGIAMASDFTLSFTTKSKPQIVAVSPGTVGSFDTNVTIEFDRTMDEATVTTTSMVLSCGGISQSGTISYNAEKTLFTFEPAAAIGYGKSCVLKVYGAIADPDGLRVELTLDTGYSYQSFDFTTEAEINVAPTANNFSFATEINASTTANWYSLSGAADGNGDSLSATVTTNGTHGTFTIISDTVTYTPDAGSTAADSAELNISDGSLSTSIVVTTSVRYYTAICTGSGFSVAIKSDGTLWGWGSNYYGQAGAGTDTGTISTSTQIGTDNNWSKVACGASHAVALKTDGSLWAWGDNRSGQIGVGASADKITTLSPVLENTTWSTIDAGQNFSVAVKSDGTLWAWGKNDVGQLGADYTVTADSNVPIQVGTNVNWKDVSAGDCFVLARTTNDTLFSWGGTCAASVHNYYGQLGTTGNGEVLYSDYNRSTPTEIGGTWIAYSAGEEHALGVQTGGTLWAWGKNISGQLGDGTSTHSTTPVQIGSSTTWSDVCAGLDHSMGIDNGSLYTWGYNAYGQLGQGDTTSRNTPTSLTVSGGTTWSACASSQNSMYSAAINDNILYMWGRNDISQLTGTADTNETSPKIVH